MKKSKETTWWQHNNPSLLTFDKIQKSVAKAVGKGLDEDIKLTVKFPNAVGISKTLWNTPSLTVSRDEKRKKA